MPKTFATFFIATLAISGIPGLSGFFSKDEILWNAFDKGGFVFWFIGVLTAMMTAFYMFRLLSLTFYGKERFDHHNVHPHESPAVMTVPLIILAVLSIIGGYIGMPAVFVGEKGNLFEHWLAPIYEPAKLKLTHFGHGSHLVEIILMIVSVVLALAAIYFALSIYLKKPGIAENVSRKFKALYNLLWNKYYVDEVYEATVIKPIQKGSEKVLWDFADSTIIDGIVNGSAYIVGFISDKIKKIQTGVVQYYAVIMMLGIAIAFLWLILSFVKI
jgi:NADH-quinone oxidoreductase subunit L